MSTEPKFRRLSEQDFDDVAVLFAELAGEPDYAVRQYFLNVLKFRGTQMFGAEVNGKVVSMATLHILPNLGGVRVAYGLVENVVTLREFQMQGFGRGVMALLIQSAWDAGAYKLMLLTGAGRGARGFYEKCGFSGESKIGMQMRRFPVQKSNVTPPSGQ